MPLPRFTPTTKIEGAASIEFGAGAVAAAAARETVSSAGASIRTAPPSTVFVELGDAAQKAQIARDGVGIPQITFNAAALDGLLAGRPQLVTKVVSQSIAPGTAVPRGTEVDVVLAQPGVLPIDVIRDPHLVLSGQSLSTVYDNFIRDSPAVRNVIARNDSAATLSTADRGVIEAAFQARDVPITEEPGHTIDQAFGSLQAAWAFGS